MEEKKLLVNLFIYFDSEPEFSQQLFHRFIAERTIIHHALITFR
jgi:hypothetical protein